MIHTAPRCLLSGNSIFDKDSVKEQWTLQSMSKLCSNASIKYLYAGIGTCSGNAN